MKSHFVHFLACSALAALGVAANAATEVRFIEPEKFTDAGYGRSYEPAAAEQNPTLAEIRRHLLGLAERCIGADQSLEIRVSDVDLAGQIEWWHRRAGYDPRVVRDSMPPRIELEYVWRAADGKVLSQATERISDLGFLRRTRFALARYDELFHEKAMLSDWFVRRFCAPGLSAADSSR